MKRLQWFLAALIAAALVVLAAPVHLARAGGDDGFTYGESHPCQVCTAQQMADHNQLALKGCIKAPLLDSTFTHKSKEALRTL